MVALTEQLIVEILTPREAEVVLLVAEGLDNRSIAGRLFLEPRTVERHLGGIFGKLNVPPGHHKRVCLGLFGYSHNDALRQYVEFASKEGATRVIAREVWDDILPPPSGCEIAV